MEHCSVLMNPHKQTRYSFMKYFVPIIYLLLFSASSLPAQPGSEEALPTLEEMVLPSVKQLLNETPKDWIVLNTGGVLTVESVTPRPDTLALRQAEIEALEIERRKVAASQRGPLSEKINELKQLEVTVPEVQGNPEFRLPIRRIIEIIHHEDLMIRRIDELLKVNNIDQSLELLNRLRRNWDAWPGMDGAHAKIVYTDAKFRIEQGKYSESLMLLDEVYRLNKEYLGVPQQVDRAIQALVEKSIENKDYPQAQFYLNWIRQRFPDRPVYQTYSTQLSNQVTKILVEANAAATSGNVEKAAILVDDAAIIWPLAQDLRGPHRTHTERYQRLHVGVVDAPGNADAYFAVAPPDLRKRRLTDLTLFELDRLRDGTAYYRTRFIDEWEPTDLGREMRFTLKQFRQPYEMQDVLTTAEIAPLIFNRLNPEHPEYDERMASYVESVEVHSPTEFTLAFHRVPPRIEPLLASLHIRMSQDESVDESAMDPGGFRLASQDEKLVVYKRKIEEPPGLPKYHVAEIVEHRYGSYEKAAQGLRRGEVSMISDLPDWIIRRMQADEEFMKRFFIIPYQLPETHLLQFNPASKAVRNRELRTALAYAVDRNNLLRENVLRDPKAMNGKVVSTPFLSSNPGKNLLVEPRRYDLSAALAMLLASRKQLKDGIPPLTMIVAPGPAAEEVAKKIAAKWKKIGIDIKLVMAHEPRPENWDVIYRSVQMVEPLVEIWPFLTIQERAKIDDLRRYPDWLKQELIQLDRTSEQSRAISALQTLHRHIWSDTAVFPLWELQRYLVIRKNVQGYPKNLMHGYDQIDRWMIDAWYQTELP